MDSLISPTPRFVSAFVDKRDDGELTREERIRALYGFLLKKRYEERLNLLHFAFHVFDDEGCLPDEIVNMTPFPHEDGVPGFRYFSRGGYELDPE